MEELTIEEKAKAYDLALERAKKWYNAPNIDKIPTYGNRIVEEIFPELKEQEDEDERIRKALINVFATHKDYEIFFGISVKDILAWLEKQDEQKPQGKSALEAIKEEKVDNANKVEPKDYNGIDPYFGKPVDKVEPKFKVGDWVVWDNKISCHIDKIYQGKESLMYTITDAHNMTRSYDVKGFDNNAHLWSIQDAKDGDVLEFGDHGRLVVGIVSHVNKTTGKVDVSCLLEDDKFKVGVFYNLDTVKPHPATKEQHDSLFAAMKEAGYEWDAEKKELKKIPQCIISAEAKEAMYGKPTAWSEEDELKRSTLIHVVKKLQGSAIFEGLLPEELIAWLESLKQRIKL